MNIQAVCKEVRKSILEMLRAGERGHIASALSLVEILSVLYEQVLRLRPQEPFWPQRDRCILSKGHGCMALYALLCRRGFFPESELKLFCRPQGILGGHPQYRKVPGVEASTGSLGHGLSIAVGQCLMLRADGRDSRIFVVMGDGECNEGSVWEAAMCAGKHRLDNLTVIVDYNKQQSYASTDEVQPLEPFAAKWEAFGFACREIDGHDAGALARTFANLPFAPGKPSALICHTVKGKGIASIEGDLEWHHKARVADDLIDSMLAEIDHA